MVYIIRHKGFWEYAAGHGYYDRNFHSFIKYLDPPKDQTLFIARKNDSYMPFRYLHVYRTMKRAANQFFQGNELLQNAFSLALRSMYLRVPEEMFTERYGGLDMLVHKNERHWELMTYNQHPLQQDIYEIFNNYCHEMNGEKTAEEDQSIESMEKALKTAVQQKRERLGLAKHETLEISDLQDIFDEQMKVQREERWGPLYVKSQEEKDREFDEANPRRVSYFH